MKDYEIKVDQSYTDGLGTVRKVIEISGKPVEGVKLRRCEDASGLTYKIVSGTRLRGSKEGDVRSTTVHSFARWAKEVVVNS